jgi:hypothetical protein
MLGHNAEGWREAIRVAFEDQTPCRHRYSEEPTVPSYRGIYHIGFPTRKDAVSLVSLRIQMS